ncbi:MAG: hypothetical protein ACK41P_03590 [Asticcacaulis sp.]
MPVVNFLPHTSNNIGGGVIAGNLSLTVAAGNANFTATYGTHIMEDGVVVAGTPTILPVNGSALVLENDSGATIVGNY